MVSGGCLVGSSSRDKTNDVDTVDIGGWLLTNLSVGDPPIRPPDFRDLQCLDEKPTPILFGLVA